MLLTVDPRTPDYRLASRENHPENTVVTVGKAHFGQEFCLIAGPCSVESMVQINTIAQGVAKCGAQVLRGGAFKPRTSPYSFTGLGEDGLKLLRQAKEMIGLPIVSEIMDAAQLSLFTDVDILQVGARNMQNYELLKALGRCGKPVILKRGLSATLEELLHSAEYLLAGGNEQVILCERGIRTFSRQMRATLDVSAIPVLKKATHLPVIVDPSHAAGLREYVEPLALAALAAGADGLMVEVHDEPETALSDGAQALTLDAFAHLSDKVHRILPILND